MLFFYLIAQPSNFSTLSRRLEKECACTAILVKTGDTDEKDAIMQEFIRSITAHTHPFQHYDRLFLYKRRLSDMSKEE